ncbi:MAG: GNAT family N-acetyltransferase [Pseudomonadota bacterium]
MRLADEHDLEAITALQHAAYAANRDVLGLEPLPLLADYDEIMETHEVWLIEHEAAVIGVLILEPRAQDMLIWSIATAPDAQRRGIGKLMLDAAEMRAQQFGLRTMRLYTGAPLKQQIAWYEANGYQFEREEALTDRTLVHFVKPLG